MKRITRKGFVTKRQAARDNLVRRQVRKELPEILARRDLMAELAHCNDPIRFVLNEVRTLVADYMSSEGCGCCSNRDEHEEHAAALAKILRVPKYRDGSGYNFDKFQTKKKRRK